MPENGDFREYLAWVRGLRYKLYNDGRFYNLENDPVEEHRIPPGTGTPLSLPPTMHREKYPQKD